MPSRATEKSLVPALDSPAALHQRFAELQAKSGAQAMAVSIADLESGDDFQYHADRWFHAASTIKVAILAGVYAAIHEGRWPPHARLHVRNRFYSAYDGSLFRVTAERDANGEVHAAIGKMMRIRELAQTHNVPVIENPPLARALYKQVDTRGVIPPEFFRAVAELLAYVYRQRGETMNAN